MSKTITRKYIERVSKRKNRTKTNVGTGGGGGGGGASQLWVEENYLSKAFFSRLFTALDSNDNAIDPNDTDTTIDTIQAQKGLWTNEFLSALGLNRGGSSRSLSDVSALEQRISQLEARIQELENNR